MRRLCWAVVLACVAALPVEAQTRESFDLIIRGGRIVDGTGNPWVMAEIESLGSGI